MYAKIFTQIFDSTIATDWQVRHVFEDFLKLADENGVVDMPFESIVRRTNIPEDVVRRAISVLESPDLNSRTPDHEGRRLLRLYDDKEWGWVIANHAKYRTITNREELKRQNRSRVATFKSTGGKAIQEESGYVYYAVCNNANEVKIGFSINPWARIKELQTARPTTEIVATERGSLTTEATRHEQFAKFRKSGEWFDFSVVIQNHVKSLQTKETSTTKPTTSLATNGVAATSPQIQKQIQKHKKKEKASAVPAATTEQPSETSKPPSEPEKKTDFAVFVEWWTDEFPKAHDGAKYVFQNAVDGSALKRLLGSLNIDQLKRIAAAAWKHRGEFNCKQAVTISGMGSRINQIRDELNSLTKKPVATESPAQEIRSLESERREKYPQLDAANEVCNQNFRTQEQLDKRKVLRERIKVIDARLAELRK